MADYRRGRHRRSRRDRDRDYWDDDPYYDDEYYEEPRRSRSRSKSLGRDLVERLSAPFSSRSRSRSSRSRSSRARSLDRHDDPRKTKMEHAIDAAVEAAVVEAFRLRKAPGKWTGSKGARVATAAAGAAALDAMLDKGSGKHGKTTLTKSVVGGLIANRLVNGSKHELKYR